jgi:hypothetical protein
MYHRLQQFWSDTMILGLTVLLVLTLIAMVEIYRTFYHGAKQQSTLDP